MIFERHVPAPPLGECVDHLWFFEGLELAHRVENVVPDGTFELIIDLRDEPRKLFARGDLSRHRSFRRGWISGAHSKHIVIDVLPGASMVGAHFRPGGAARLLGHPADELADDVVELDRLWGTDAAEWRESLLAERTGKSKLQLLERLLARRLHAAGGPSPMARATRVRQAMRRLEQSPVPLSIAGLADELGVSHKHLIHEFRTMVGLTPKVYGRIRRFQQVLHRIHQEGKMEWADVACACGYYDQSHFVREFKEFAGLNPTDFLSHTVGDPKFIPLGEEG
jgi:AraC-like DNA-binding protein